jgi:hypothetical protein
LLNFASRVLAAQGERLEELIDARIHACDRLTDPDQRKRQIGYANEDPHLSEPRMEFQVGLVCGERRRRLWCKLTEARRREAAVNRGNAPRVDEGVEERVPRRRQRGR